MITEIPREEFKLRIAKTQDLMRKDGYDLLLTYGNEAEPQYVRYYSDYWPSFETAGVLIPAAGEPTLLIGRKASLMPPTGPESIEYAC